MSDLPVLLVLGSGRNGSTLLGNMLGSVDGVVDVGELHWIWDRGMGENRICGCSRPFRECEFWGEALATIDDVTPADAAERARLRHAALEGLAPLRYSRQRWEERITPEQRAYLDLISRLYRAAARTAGATAVVDTSKRPVYGLAVSRAAGVDVRVLHLVRDPRAVAFSWRRRKRNPDLPDGGFMRRHPSWKSALGWSIWNLWAERIGRRRRDHYLRIRYEDLMREPTTVVGRISGFFERDLSAALAGPREAVVAESHTVSGNPSRFHTGTVPLREDLEWVTGMSRWSRWIVTAITWPLMIRYGYPLRRSRVGR